jgi:hypothetical protein
MTGGAATGILVVMNTTHDSPKASEGKSPWWCWAIWWLEAFALLVAMVVISVCRAFQEQRPEALGEDSEGFAGHPSVI